MTTSTATEGGDDDGDLQLNGVDGDDDSNGDRYGGSKHDGVDHDGDNDTSDLDGNEVRQL